MLFFFYYWTYVINGEEELILINQMAISRLYLNSIDITDLFMKDISTEKFQHSS